MDIQSFCVPLLAGDFAVEMQDAIDTFGMDHNLKSPKALPKFAIFFLNGQYMTGEEDEYYDTDEEIDRAQQLRQEARDQFARMCADAGIAVERLSHTIEQGDGVDPPVVVHTYQLRQCK